MHLIPLGTIRQRLQATLMAAVAIALGCASAATLTYEVLAYRSALVRDLRVRADLVEASSTAALAFEDRAQAAAALRPLAAQGDILCAALFTRDGTCLARWGKGRAAQAPPPPGGDLLAFSRGRVRMVRTISLHGRRLGTLSLTADPASLRRALAWGAAATLAIAALSFGLALALARGLLKRLATPLADLAATARSVADTHDYGVRVQATGQDELGTLMRDFNGMLAQIEQRDRELRAHRERLEELVAERTAQVEREMQEHKSLERQFLRAQRMESLGTLAGGVAHDLNNILTPILLSIEALEESAATPTAQRMLALIDASARRGSDIVRQILDFSRGTEGERVAVDLPTLYDDLAAIIRRTFPKTLTLAMEPPADLPEVIGNPTQIHQMLLNLCVNARDAMAGGEGRLTLGAGRAEVTEAQARQCPGAVPGVYVALTVADTGCGMPPQVMDRMYEPFYTTKEAGKGTGLGLSTVHTIARAHGGFVRCTSAVNRGTTFQVYLPAGAVARGAVARAALPAQPAPAAVPSPEGSGKRVLVADDEAYVREMTRHTLETFGFQVVTAADGRQAVAELERRRDGFAVALVDMMMPVLDGPGAIQALRRLQPGLRIIATSGLPAPSAPDPGAVADAFLPKPFNAEQLLGTLQRALEAELPRA